MCYAFKRHAFFDILLVIHDKDSIPPLQRPWPSAAVDLFGFLLIAALLRRSLHRLTGPARPLIYLSLRPHLRWSDNRSQCMQRSLAIFCSLQRQTRIGDKFGQCFQDQLLSAFLLPALICRRASGKSYTIPDPKQIDSVRSFAGRFCPGILLFRRQKRTCSRPSNPQRTRCCGFWLSLSRSCEENLFGCRLYSGAIEQFFALSLCCFCFLSFVSQAFFEVLQVFPAPA